MSRERSPRPRQAARGGDKGARKTPSRRTTPPARRSPSTTPDGDTEQQILDAAHAVFVRHGTSGARMQDIAAEAGVNQALLHYYFRSKERLSEAVFRRAAGQLMPRVIEVMASEVPIADKVHQVIALELDHLSRSPYLPGYIISELHHHPERVRQLIASVTGMAPEDVRPKVFTTVRRQLEEAATAGTMRPIAPDQFMVNLLSLCIFPFAARPMITALLGFDAGGFDRFIERRQRQLADFFLGALRP